MGHRTAQSLQYENTHLKQRIAELEAALAAGREATPPTDAPSLPQPEILPAGETLYRIVARHFPNGTIALLDHDLRYILVDGAGLDDMGFFPDALAGQTIWEVLPPATSAILEPHCRAALAGTTTSFEATYRTRSYEVHTLPVYDDAGNILACMVMTQDITRRKRVEEALQHSEQFKQAILDALSAHIAVLDASSTIIVVNKAWNDFAAANPPVNSPIAEGVNYLQVCDLAAGASSEGSQEFAAGLRAVLTGNLEHFALEYPCHAPDERRWFIAHITRFDIDDDTYLVVAHEDITQRKLAEEALHQMYDELEERVRQRTDELAQSNRALQAEISEHRQTEAALRRREATYRAMFEKNRAVKLLIEPDTGAIVDANPAASEFYGYPLPVLRTMNIAQINILPEEEILAELERAKQEQQRYFQFQHRLASGEIRDVEVYTVPIEIQGQLRLHAIIHDITERRQAENALRQAHAELEIRVEERTAQLLQSNQALKTEMWERQRAVEALSASETRYRIVSELISDYAYAVQLMPDGTAITEWATDAYTRTTGFNPDGMEADNHWKRLIHPEDWPIAQRRHERLLSGQPDVSEFRIVTRSGAVRWLRDYGKPVWDAAKGRVVRIYGAAQDITERKQAEEALHLAQFALDRAADAVIWIDPDGQYLYVNDVACQYHAAPREELLDRCITDINANISDEDWKQLWQHVKQHGSATCETEIHRKDGSVLPVEITGNHLAFKGQEYLCSFIRDITERKAAEEQLRHQALHDALTDLPNRALFMELLEHALRRTRRDPAGRFAVLFLDLDNFKVVNDSLGHLEGDHLLTITARRLQECLRVSDTIARFGGDEFVILLEDLYDEADALALVYRIQQALAHPLYINDQELSSSASIGIVLNADEHQCPADLLRDADTAMYRAKARGPGHYAVFDTTMHSSVVQRLDTENALRHAIEQEQLRLYYQPIVSLSTGQVAGFEALVRWQHPQRGLISPGDFIPIAEETGLIIPLGWWVLRAACRQMRHWQEQVAGAQALTIGVNLSSKAFMRDDIVEQIRQILQETGLAAAGLKIEITENVMMDHVETTITKLTRLRDLGVQLCIDDFGTGYSSLRYLHRFPIQTLKIDRSFVGTLNVNDESAAITQSIVMLSHTLRKETVAEGIETMAQLRYLQELHCEYGQGYFFSRPVDPITAEKMLTATFPVNPLASDPDGSNGPGNQEAPPVQHPTAAGTPCRTIIALLQQRVNELEQRLNTCRQECAELRQEHDPLWVLADTERLDVSHVLTRSSQAEAVLRVWERALATVTSGILITDVNRPDMPIIYCNAAFERMTGYTPAETLGRNCRFLQGPDTDPADVAEIREAVAARQGCQVVLLNYRKDGTPFWNELAITPLYDPAGRLTHYIGMITDVTGRKRMEDALQTSEETFRGFFEQSQDALLLVDDQGSVTAWNQGAEQIFGLSRTETLGQPKWDVLFRLTPEEYRTPAMYERIKAAVLNMIYNAGQGNPIYRQPIERETQLPDGTHRTVSTRIFPIQTNTGLLLGGITRDITKLKRTEAAIRESQGRLQAILDNAAVGIVLLDREGHFIEVNDRWIEMLGMTRYEVYRKSRLDLVSPEDSATSREAMQPLLRGEVAGFRLEQRFRRKDGSLFWGDLSTRALLNDQGELESVIGIIADITERKQAEQALQLAHAQSQVWVSKLRQRNRDMTLLNELSDGLQTCRTVNDAYQAIVPVISRLFPNRAGALYIVDATRTYLELAVAWGPPQRWPPGFAGAICRTLTQGPLHTSGPGATDICCRMADSAIPSLCVPLVAHGETLGVLRLSEMELPSLTARRRAERLTVTVADYLALAIANLQLREHLQNQAIRDALTGLFNRRYLDETLQRELQHAARHQRPVGVIMLDVDHFKQFNDRFGHKGGDALLQALGAFLQQHIRSEDIACRYGGEEFMLILPEATLKDTQIRAEQLRAGVAQLRITHEQQQLDTVTISLGVAGFPTHGSTTATLIGAADAALYRAKTSGRNRVISATLPLVEAPGTAPLCT